MKKRNESLGMNLGLEGIQVSETGGVATASIEFYKGLGYCSRRFAYIDIYIVWLENTSILQ